MKTTTQSDPKSQITSVSIHRLQHTAWINYTSRVPGLAGHPFRVLDIVQTVEELTPESFEKRPPGAKVPFTAEQDGLLRSEALAVVEAIDDWMDERLAKTGLGSGNNIQRYRRGRSNRRATFEQSR